MFTGWCGNLSSSIYSNLDDCMVFTFYQTASNKQTKKSLGCHQVSSLDMNMLSHPQGVATAVVYSTADGAMWAKDREIGRFRRSVNLLRNMQYNHRKNWIYPRQQVSWLVMWFFSSWRMSLGIHSKHQLASLEPSRFCRYQKELGSSVLLNTQAWHGNCPI